MEKTIMKYETILEKAFDKMVEGSTYSDSYRELDNYVRCLIDGYNKGLVEYQEMSKDVDLSDELKGERVSKDNVFPELDCLI